MRTGESDRLLKGYSKFLKRCGYSNVSIEEPKACSFPSLEYLYSESIVALNVDSKNRFLVLERHIGKDGKILGITMDDVALIRSIEENYSLAHKISRMREKTIEKLEKACLQHPDFMPFGVQLGSQYGVLVYYGIYPNELSYGHFHPVSNKILVFDFSKGHTIFVRALSPIKSYLPAFTDIKESYSNNKENAVFWLNLEKADYDLLREAKEGKEKIVQEIARRNAPYYEVVGIQYHMKGERNISIGPLIPKPRFLYKMVFRRESLFHRKLKT